MIFLSRRPQLFPSSLLKTAPIESGLQFLNHSSKLSADNIPCRQQPRVSHRGSDPVFVPLELPEGTSDEWLRLLTNAEGSPGPQRSLADSRPREEETPARDFRTTACQHIGESSLRKRALANVEAIPTLLLETETGDATEAEKIHPRLLRGMWRDAERLPPLAAARRPAGACAPRAMISERPGVINRDGVIVRKITAFEMFGRASTTTRQPPLVNRRSSVNRLVNRQPVDAGERFASDCAIRHTVCSASLKSGVSGKSPRDAALVRLMRTGERESCPRFGEFRGFVSRRRKAGSLHGSSKIR
jgi:hypothetical protein